MPHWRGVRLGSSGRCYCLSSASRSASAGGSTTDVIGLSDWPFSDDAHWQARIRSCWLWAPPGAIRIACRSWAIVLCYGDVEVPEAGTFQFEPEIISPTRAMWRELIWLPPIMVLVCWWILYASTALPVPRITLNRVAIGFSYLLMAGIATAAVWIWRAGIRPRYFRLAPGMVQVFEYKLLRSRPTVRSYPVEAGSVFVIARLTSGPALLLSRGDASDAIRLGSVRDGRQVMKRLWQALLSTAPTPPLSDEELTG
jgi:hypothetical protein